MGVVLVVALLIIVTLASFFAFSNPETRERLLLVGGVIVITALAAYVLATGAQSSSGELNEAVGDATNRLANTAIEISGKIGEASPQPP